MTEDIKRKIIIRKNVIALTKVTCDCCKRELGMFHIKLDDDAWHVRYKEIPDAKPVEWYHIVKSQNYEKKTEWLYDICPECFPNWMLYFRDKELGCNDFMEMHIEHHMDIPQDLE